MVTKLSVWIRNLITQKLHCRINQHRANIKKGFLVNVLSRHFLVCLGNGPFTFSVPHIDYVPLQVSNWFEQLKKKEMFWIYRVGTFQPFNLNEVTKLVIWEFSIFISVHLYIYLTWAYMYRYVYICAFYVYIHIYILQVLFPLPKWWGIFDITSLLSDWL